jgi:hypothetical protein
MQMLVGFVRISVIYLAKGHEPVGLCNGYGVFSVKYEVNVYILFK